MKRIFFSLLATLLVINFTYKAVLYCSYQKIEGTVVGFETFRYMTSHTSKRGGKYLSYHQLETPIVLFTLNDTVKRATSERWGEENVRFFNEGDHVTVLVDKETGNIYLNSLFLFWFRFYDIFWGILILIFGSIFLGIVLPDRRFKKPTEWK